MRKNTVVVSGEIDTISPVRFTPAGLTVLHFTIQHHSDQKEAGIVRKVSANVACILIGEALPKLEYIQNGRYIKVRGFLAAFSAKRQHRLLLHVTAYQLTD